MGFFDIIKDIGRSVASDAISNYERQVKEYEKKVNAYEKKVNAYEEKIDRYEQTHPNADQEKIKAAREKINNFKRRTDGEIAADSQYADLKPRDFQYKCDIPLEDAIRMADSKPGVYVLYLNGQQMKCGRAVIGVSMRLSQYYHLNYDDRARQGEYWSVNEQNKNQVTVSWQCCPPQKCQELEYKLFKKYGKGPWAKRMPSSCNSNSWELLI